MKEIIEIIQKKIKEKNEEKLKDVEKYEMSIKHRELESEKETLNAIEEFEQERKVSLKVLEEKPHTSIGRQEVDKLMLKIQALKDKLLAIEV